MIAEDEVKLSTVAFVRSMEYPSEFRHGYIIKALIDMQMMPYNNILYRTLFDKTPHHWIPRVTMAPLTRYVKVRVTHAPEWQERFPRYRSH